MSGTKMSSQAALAPAERYESCPMCHACVVESRLICQACIRAGNFTALRGEITFAELQAHHSALTAQKASLQCLMNEAVDAPWTSPTSCPSLVSRRCECRLRIVQLRRALAAARDAVNAERSRRAAARQAVAAMRREGEIYRRKTADLTAGLEALKARLQGERARTERATRGAAKRARSLCRLMATEVYNLHETERSLVQSRMRLPPLSSFPSRSLEPAPQVYQALLAASSLLQAVTACLAAWTPFQPVAITFLRSPLSRDSVSAQHRKLEVALHSLCCRYATCLALFSPGDPLLTLCRLLESPNLGIELISQQRIDDRHGAKQRPLEFSVISYDPFHVKAEWELPTGGHDSNGHGSCAQSAAAAFFSAPTAASANAAVDDDDWVEVDDGFPIPVDESCCESRAAFLTSLWR